MAEKRKPTYEQALGLEAGQNAARRAARERAAFAPDPLTPEERAAWEERRKKALKNYRASLAAKRAAEANDGS